MISKWMSLEAAVHLAKTFSNLEPWFASGHVLARAKCLTRDLQPGEGVPAALAMETIPFVYWRPPWSHYEFSIRHGWIVFEHPHKPTVRAEMVEVFAFAMDKYRDQIVAGEPPPPRNTADMEELEQVVREHPSFPRAGMDGGADTPPVVPEPETRPEPGLGNGDAGGRPRHQHREAAIQFLKDAVGRDGAFSHYTDAAIAIRGHLQTIVPEARRADEIPEDDKTIIRWIKEDWPEGVIRNTKRT
jgi:hypothetical protein